MAAELVPKIKPLSISTVRPLWSVMIPTYNCIRFLEQSINSVLLQDMGDENMEIIVVGDCSTDGDIRQLVHHLGKGRVKYIRQTRNVGSLKNFEHCINTATGYYIHLLHGDDFVEEGFYRTLTELFVRYPTAGAACCRYMNVDSHSTVLGEEIIEQEEGLLESWLLKLSKKQRLQYCCVAVKRSVYEELGSFHGVTYGEDWLMWVKIASKYPFAYSPKLLSSYRYHSHSVSAKSKHSGSNISDIKWVIDHIQDYLPYDERKTAYWAARKWYSRYSLSGTFSIWEDTGEITLVLKQIKGIYSLYFDSNTLWKTLVLAAKIFVNLSYKKPN